MSDDLEQELRRLTPVPPASALDIRITRALKDSAFRISHSAFTSPASHSSDRLLATTLSLAAAAAILIVTLLTTDYLKAPAPPPAQIASDQPHPTTLADTQRFLAQLTDDGPPRSSLLRSTTQQ